MAHAADRPPSLKQAAARIGLIYGSDSDVAFEDAPKAYTDLFIEQCDLYGALLSWGYACPTRTGPCPSREDPNIPVVLRHGLRLTGGHLLWHESAPSWFPYIRPRAEAEHALMRHIADLAGHYAGKVFSWNVVNEALRPEDDRPDGLRETPALSLFGPDYFDMAFRAARAADPNALLVYNDYGLEMDSPGHAAKRDALLRLLDRLRRGRVPIDAVGIQSHLKLDGTPFDDALFRRFLAEIAGRGLRILITELDVLDLQPAASPAEQDAQVAALYGAYLRSALDEPAVASVVTWGLANPYTWLTPDQDPGNARSDGQAVRPLPFDDAFRPTAAFTAIVEAFRHAPVRSKP